YEWDLDYDGSFSIGQIGILANFTYMDDGEYQIVVRAFDDDGSMSEFQGTITVLDLLPTANITTTAVADEGSPLEFNGNLSASFPDDLSSYEWDFFYDGTFDPEVTGVFTHYTYMDNGTYTVALRVTDDDGSIHIATVVVTINDLVPSPIIDTVATVDEGMQFNLTSRSTSFPDLIFRLEWDFEYDGVTFSRDSTGEMVQHTYMDNGCYTVALRLTDDDGSVVMTTFDVEAFDLGPTADIAINGIFEEGTPLILDARGSLSYPDEVVAFDWDLDYRDDEFTADMEGETVEHSYLDHGTYTIAFRITDEDGTQDMVFQTIEVFDLSPAAVISIGILSHAEGTLVVFNAGSSTSSPDELVAYHWDWDGDGEVDDTTTDENGRHVFTSPGRYEVTLTVEDDDGSTDTDSVFVTISDVGPTVKLDADPTPEGQVALLDASGTKEPGNDFVAFRWDLDGDGVWDHEETCSSLEVVW
ncbi:MAG: PKD domain-containing protein, partial [Thermoplasmata archaeon]|nr:PKD domain-containing protein [Thermoplasmata archaeon]